MEWYHNSQNPVATLTVVSELQWRIFQVVLASKRKSVALVPDLGKFLFGKMGGYQCGTTHLPVWLVRYFEYHLDTIFFYKFNGTVSFLLLCLFPPKTNPPGKHRNPYVPFSLRGATGTIWVLGVVQFFWGKNHLKQRPFFSGQISIKTEVWAASLLWSTWPLKAITSLRGPIPALQCRR